MDSLLGCPQEIPRLFHKFDIRRPLKTSEQIPQKDVIMEQGDTDEKSDDDVWSRCAA